MSDMMIIPIGPSDQKPRDHTVVTGERVELWVGPETRMFFIHTNEDKEVVLSDFRSGLRMPHADLSAGTPQEALDRVVYRFKAGYMLAVMSAYSQLNLL